MNRVSGTDLQLVVQIEAVEGTTLVQCRHAKDLESGLTWVLLLCEQH